MSKDTVTEKLYTLSTGDEVYRYEKSIVIFFKGKRKVLSTSVFNGGYHENYNAVFNHDAKQGAGMPCEMLAPTYTEHMQILSGRLGLNPETVTGMGTAADMENAAIETLSYQDLTVTAIVTGGIETNGGRVGDPADFFKPLEKPDKPGTINIMLVLDTDLPPGTLTRALVTCTEAKTAAIQELLEGSKYSNGIATGSGTDTTIVVANSESPLYLEGAGKHSKLGELIGRVVKEAVKKALDKQTGLNPKSQHNALRRLQRFGVRRPAALGLLRRGQRQFFKQRFSQLLGRIEIELEARAFEDGRRDLTDARVEQRAEPFDAVRVDLKAGDLHIREHRRQRQLDLAQQAFLPVFAHGVAELFKKLRQRGDRRGVFVLTFGQRDGIFLREPRRGIILSGRVENVAREHQIVFDRGG